jgi:transcriptional regulator with XRE-family HTH domain
LSAEDLFHERLPVFMEAAGLSRTDLAKTLGVAESQVTRWLDLRTAGGTVPGGVTLGWLVQLLGVGVRDLIGPAPAGPGESIEDRAAELETMSVRYAAAARVLRGEG